MKRIAFLCAALSLAMAGPTSAADNTPEWLNILRNKMAMDLKCSVTRASEIAYDSVEGRKFANYLRLYCHDGRVFEARRDRLHQPFRISECGPAVC